MGFAKPIEQYLFGNLLTKIHGFMYLKDIIRGGNYMFEPKMVSKGDNGLSVLLLQEILRARGFKGKDGKDLKLDRDAGTNTIHALKEYQKSRKGVLEVDGICGTATWKDLIAI